MAENPENLSGEQGADEGVDEELGSGRRRASPTHTAGDGGLDDEELREAQEGKGYGASGLERDDE